MINLDGKNSRIVKMKIEPLGRAPIKYGNAVFRFEDSVLENLLPQRGWSLIKKNKRYQYFQVPQNEKEPYSMEVRIPQKEFIKELADKYNREGKSVYDKIGEWPIGYKHNFHNKMAEYRYDAIKNEAEQEIVEDVVESLLFIGGSIWSADVSIIDGNAEYSENNQNIEHSSKKVEGEKIHEKYSMNEGKIYLVLSTKYERSPEARIECIKYYGTKCQICGFSFEEYFGPLGKDIINVHHIVPISKIGSEYKINPIKDLIPVCANCHTMIHSREPVYSIDEVKELIKK
jgi:HNH endonuclease